MDFFERAHVLKKQSSTMENKPNEAVKRQLKQMMSAYKKGNNEDIRISSEIKPNYLEDSISNSDFSEFKDADNSTTTDSSKSDSLDTVGNTHEGSSVEDIIECCEEFKALSTSMDDSATTSFSSSAVFESSDSNDSDLSIPSSLQTSTGSATSTNGSDDEFDADGTLASKILENIGKKEKISKKRKIPKDNVVLELRKDVNKTKESSDDDKIKKKTKKVKHDNFNSSTESFVVEDVGSDSTSLQSNQRLKKVKQATDSKIPKKEKKPIQKQLHQIELIESSDHSSNNTMDSISTSVSSPFISVSAENMSSQSLSELLGDYVHPTIRNLPAEYPVRNSANMFSAEDMIVKDVIDDEISSLIPEVDEELAVEDLNADTDTQELIQESNTFNDNIPTEDTIEPGIEDMTTDSRPIDESIAQEELDIDEAVPMTLYNGLDKYVLVMKHPAELYIHGKVQIGDINGMVEIYGYKLNYDSVEVYAPYCSFAHCLRTVENPHETNPDLFNELILVGVSVTDAKEILFNIEDNTAVVLLTKLNSRMIDFVDNCFSTAELFSKRNDSSIRFLKKAAESLGCSFYLRPPRRSFEEKAIWTEVYASSARDGSRGIICGGKGTGKSTFLRHYVNTLLADGPVLVIDLDPGQSEFTVPGNISATIVERPLIGPNFTHLQTPEKMLNIGIINTMDNAKRYLSAVSELITYCRASEDFRHLPWIVNTMGLCNHMGLKFMTSIILQIQPTFLFQIDSKVPKKRFEVNLDPPAITRLYESYLRDRAFRNVPDPYLLKYSFIIARYEENTLKVPVGASLLPRDERYLNILAYFGELLNEHRSQGLMDVVPYEVNLVELNIGLNVKIPADSVAKVINGKIIALCQQKSYDKGQVFTLGDKALLCHGHGLIRGIDFELGLLYVLTPTHIGKLASVDTLMYSDWMPELRGLEHDLPSGTIIPYRTANTGLHQRQLMFPPRRRFNPLKLLNMSRNT